MDALSKLARMLRRIGELTRARGLLYWLQPTGWQNWNKNQALQQRTTHNKLIRSITAHRERAIGI